MNKAYIVRLYPNKSQISLLEKTFGCVRFIYNQMLNERKQVYEKLKKNKDELFSFVYKTEKEYKQDFEWLKEVSSRALQQSRIDLQTAYTNFYKGLIKGKKIGFPKFKSKRLSRLSYREPQVNNCIKIENNKIKLLKLGFVKFRGLNKKFSGTIKSVTVYKTKTGKYFASILVEKLIDKKQRISNNTIGIDLGLKDFAICSNGEIIQGIKQELYNIEHTIKILHKHFSRKKDGSKRKEKARIKLAKSYEYKTNFLNHFQWSLVNKLCSENQTICLEMLNVKGMIKNRKLSHAIHTVNWSSFVNKLEQKAKEYNTTIFKVPTFYPSSKTCSRCGTKKKDLLLSDRTFFCNNCELSIDRDYNASINIRNFYIKSLEYKDYERGEIVRPKELKTILYNSKGSFYEAFRKSL